MGFPGGSDSQECTCNAGDLGSIPGLGRSPGGGLGNPLQCFCWRIPMERGPWRATVHWVTKSSRSHNWAAKHNIPEYEYTIVCLYIYYLRASRLLPGFGNYKSSGHEHPYADFCVYVKFPSHLVNHLGTQLLDHKVKTILSSARNCQKVFQSGCTILHSHQQWIKVHQ